MTEVDRAALAEVRQLPVPAVAEAVVDVVTGATGAVTEVVSAVRARATAPARRAPAWRAPLTDLLLGLAGTTAAVPLLGLAVLPALALPCAWVALLASCRAYDPCLVLTPGAARWSRVLGAGARLAVCCWVVATLGGGPAVSEQLLVVVLALVGSALVARSAGAVLAGPTAPTPRILVAGRPGQVRASIQELRRVRRRTFDVAAVCLLHGPTDGPAAVDDLDVPLVRGLDQVAPGAAAWDVDAVVVLPDEHLDPRSLQRLGWELERTRTALFVGTGLLDVASARTTLTGAAGMRVLHVRAADLTGPAHLLKDVVERCAAIVGLLLLSPVLLALVVAVRRDSPGPALFRQVRVGRGGRPFTMYKLRTMTTGAPDLSRQERNDASGVLFKLRTDPRITRVGRVLRRYSLDELPQLVNIARGEMALVGPRPALPAEVARYDHDPRRRLVVKPGLTGLWQVSGRSDLSWDESVRLDLLYVDNWSLGLDASILVRTARAVLGHQGAY